MGNAGVRHMVELLGHLGHFIQDEGRNVDDLDGTHLVALPIEFDDLDLEEVLHVVDLNLKDLVELVPHLIDDVQQTQS